MRTNAFGKTVFISAIVALVCAGAQAGRTRPEEFRFERTLTPAEAPKHDMGAFVLDSFVYAHTDASLGGLRLFDSSGAEVPYVMRKVTVPDTVEYMRTTALKRIGFSEKSGNSIVVDFERDSSLAVPSAVELTTPNVDFDRNLTVYGSSDGSRWTVLADRQPIFDYRRFIDVRNTRVTFPQKEYRFYRLEIAGVTQRKRSPFTHMVRELSGSSGETWEQYVQTQESLRIDDIEFEAPVQQVRLTATVDDTCELAIDRVVSDTTKGYTWLYVRGGLRPTHTILLVSRTPNYRRAVSVEGTSDTTDTLGWRWICSDEIMSVRAGEFSRADSAISLGGEYRLARYRIKITDNDNSPLDISAIRGVGERREIVFFRSSQQKLRLCYGHPDSAEPRYDISSVLAAAPRLSYDTWQAGLPSENPDAALSTARKTIPMKAVLIAAVLIMAAVLGWAIFKAVGHLDTSDNETSSSNDTLAGKDTKAP